MTGSPITRISLAGTSISRQHGSAFISPRYSRSGSAFYYADILRLPSSAACCWHCVMPRAACVFSAIQSQMRSLFVFTVSAVLAGLAGALYVPQVGIITPSEFSPGNSIEIAIWVSVGGRGTLIGPIVGSVLVNLAKTWLTGAAPETWLFVLGALFVLTTLVFPRGIVGLLWRPGRIGPRAAAPVPAGEQA